MAKEVFYGDMYRYAGSKRGIILNFPYPANLIYVAFGEVSELWIATKEFQRNFNQALQELTERQRRVIELRYKEGLTLTAVGKSLGISETTVSCDESKVLEFFRSFDCKGKLFTENKMKQAQQSRSIDELPLHSRYVKRLKEAGYSDIGSVYQDYNNGSLILLERFGDRGLCAVKRSLEQLSLI